MGDIFEHSFAELGYTQRIMKILLAIALFGAVQAAPEAEADPAVLYGGYYSYGLTDGPNNGLGPVHALGKREAEADAEADPAVLYGGYYGYGLGYYGGYYGYGLPYYAHAGLPYSYGWTDGPNNGLGPVHALGKREAEAEADPAVLYGGYYGLGYYGGYRGYYGLPYYAHAGLPYSYGW